MSNNLSTVSDATSFMAHTVILGGIIANMPEDKRDLVRQFALSTLDNRIAQEKSKEKPNKDIIALLVDARDKAINFFG